MRPAVPEYCRHRVGIPRGGGDQPLHSVRCDLARRLGELPPIAALDAGEQHLEVGPSHGTGRGKRGAIRAWRASSRRVQRATDWADSIQRLP